MSGLLNKITGGDTPYSEEEQNRIRGARADFNGAIQSYQRRATEGKEKRTLSPEGALNIMKKNTEATEWLANNASAKTVEIQAQKDKYENDIRLILETDMPKATFRSYYMGLQYIGQKNELPPKVIELVLTEAKKLEDWYNKHEMITNNIELQQMVADSELRILEAIVDTSVRDRTRTDIENIKKKPADAWKSDIAIMTKNQTIIKNSEFRWTDMMESAVLVFAGLPMYLIFLLCLFAGSLAANSAIHRPALYRVLFFIYGAFPLFSGFVLFYFLLQRFRCGPMPLYGFLPILSSTAECDSQSKFLAFLRAIITYYPDPTIDQWRTDLDNCIQQFKQD
jgi:hypothetical protein